MTRCPCADGMCTHRPGRCCIHGEGVTRLRWFVRRIFVPLLAWSMARIPLGELREAFDLSYKHRDEEWRRHVWSLAAERAERKVSR